MSGADGIPSRLQPPIKLALAKPVASIPEPGALPGGCLYEPKWDGYRIAIIREEDGTELWSRNGNNLTAYFPDLALIADDLIPPGCIIDGEAVIWNNDRLDFGALQARVGASKRNLARVVQDLPAHFTAFDLLCVAGRDARKLPLSSRRELLEELAADWAPPMTLSPATRDPDLARTWFETMPATGIEGLVIKGTGTAYDGGERQWLKVKHRDTLDLVCGAVTGPISRPATIIAGIMLDGDLTIVGRTVPLSADASKILGRMLAPAEAGHPWPEEFMSASMSRFNAANGPTRLTLVQPVVMEVTADAAFSGTSFRHPLRFVRLRPELSPDEVDVPAHFGR